MRELAEFDAADTSNPEFLLCLLDLRLLAGDEALFHRVAARIAEPPGAVLGKQPQGGPEVSAARSDAAEEPQALGDRGRGRCGLGGARGPDRLGRLGDRGAGGSSSPAAVAGYPNIAVPVGQVFGLPLGISFFGRAFSEPTLIKLAFAFEQATQARKAPKFLTTVG